MMTDNASYGAVPSSTDIYMLAKKIKITSRTTHAPRHQRKSEMTNPSPKLTFGK